MLQFTLMSDSKKRPSDSVHDRRAFFRRGLSHLVTPAVDYITTRFPGMAPGGSRPLRPPGAMLEPDFLDTCYRCGSCADHCPADSITLIEGDDERLKGTPTIDPTRRACVMCDDLTCMKGCPSGALKLVERSEIRIGLAIWDAETCTRKAASDPGTATPNAGSVGSMPAEAVDSSAESSDDPSGPASCTICVDVCPVGVDAIRIGDGVVNVIDPRPIGKGCTGCGVCQEQCPTRPKRAIRVRPYALPKR